MKPEARYIISSHYFLNYINFIYIYISTGFNAKPLKWIAADQFDNTKSNASYIALR